ncbi:hypothetical protein VNO80_03846 [Phaseolus coccineus]|uniref:Uncharacterized protein n=1 Tax=Phaseolus coccineus TaxID=3886 RepID=A0AAN9NSI7_PHACN
MLQEKQRQTYIKIIRYSKPRYCSTRPKKNALGLTVSQAEEEPFFVIVSETQPSPPFIYAFKVSSSLSLFHLSCVRISKHSLNNCKILNPQNLLVSFSFVISFMIFPLSDWILPSSSLAARCHFRRRF